MQSPATFTVYNASAGSGKTFTLVKEYLKILLQSDKGDFAFQNVLAITFTNKAAAEMKERVLQTLQAISEGESNDMMEKILEETGIPRPELQERCRRLILAILQNYGAFHITTIDSFTHQLIKSFAFDLGLSLNFEVTVDTKELLTQAIDVLISKIGTNEILTDTLVEFSLYKISDNKSWDVAYDLNDIAELLLNESDTFAFQQIADRTIEEYKELAARIQTKTKECASHLKSIGEEGLTLFLSNGLTKNDFFRGTIYNFFDNLSKNPKNFKPTLKDSLENGGTFYKKNTAVDIANCIDGLIPKISELFNLAEGVYNKMLLLETTGKNIIPLALVNAIHQELSKLQEEENSLLISDFNKLIYNTIKNQPAPYIYERIGQKFSHYFIDEMQDTSVLQWQNIIPLVANALSQEKTGLLLVGDGKQSIYRFRGGEPEQFIALGSHHTSVPQIQIPKNVQNLEWNFRSYSEVVSFNNGFFKHIASYLDHEMYKDLFMHQSYQKVTDKKGGYVSMTFIDKTENVAEKADKFCEQVHHKIIDVREQFEYSEICVLVRNNKIGAKIAEYLVHQSIPVISPDSILLKNSPKVSFIIRLLSVITDETDKNALFDVLYFLHGHVESQMSEHEFINRYIHKGAAVFVHLQQEGIQFDLTVYQELSLYEKVEYIVRAFKLVTHSDSYVQYFLEKVLQQQSKDATVIGFLEFWELKKDTLSVSSNSEANAVQIMTVHKSKGLEFPVVIFPFDQAINDVKRNKKIWIHELPEDPFGNFTALQVPFSTKLQQINESTEQLYEDEIRKIVLDEINVMYVAFTRAKEQLYLVAEKREVKSTTKSLYASEIYQSYLKSIQKWDETQYEYSFGNPQRKSESTKQIEASVTQEKFMNHTWRDHEVIVLANASKLWGTYQGEAIAYGNLIHEMLAQIIEANDIERVLKSYHQKGILTSDLEHEVRNMVESIVYHPKLADYFSNRYQVYAERGLVVQKQLFIPDRLMINDQMEAIIIDYKTGVRDKSHQQQLISYQDALETMGYKVTKKIVIYISESLAIEEI